MSELPEAEAEARRAERRRLIANNKAWDSAETVRRTWLESLIARKTLPKDAGAFIAVTMTTHRTELTGDQLRLAPKLLRVKYDALPALAESNPARAGHITLAVVLSAREHATNRESWRSPNPSNKNYLLQLESWGYALSNVERIAAGYTDETTDNGPAKN